MRPGERTPPTQCEACQGSGQEAIGEHFVTREMAMDAGEPAMEGMSAGVEWGPCSECGGSGLAEAPPSAPPPAETVAPDSNACPETGEDDCPRCSGEYCDQHFTEPCECDTAERHMPKRAAEAPAETPRETFTEEGWALRRKDTGGMSLLHGRVVIWNTREEADRELVFGGRDVWEPVPITRTVTVQVHEP